MSRPHAGEAWWAPLTSQAQINAKSETLTFAKVMGEFEKSIAPNEAEVVATVRG